MSAVDVAAVVERMERAGFRLNLSGDKLQVRPAERLTQVQREWLTRHKASLVAHLAAEQDKHVADMVKRFDAQVVAVRPATESTPPVLTLPPPPPHTVRCLDCVHALLGLPGDETGAWRICTAGGGGRFGLQRHHCGQYQDKRRLV